ncbi:GFA family protein [Sphingomonas rhizophila]|uniref:GFA family protein n=1 Tax=Sphingomonas rhizophila TaxID=2071607 RepID=A0A7G9SD77_9SPHN|nr:GFA family protein [Sphingomonas rhizophila]QNN65802.1 GFA family protein [Sphingomonas rhizophila]
MTAMPGGCACGRVRFEADVESDEAYLCHCRMCQRASGNVSLAMLGIAQAKVRWDGEPDWYDSSPIAHRPFCSVCGTTLGFAYRDSDKMDLTVAAFDEPSRFRPVHHFGAENIHESWINTSDLPRIRTDEHKSLVKRWVDATGEFPG